MKMGWVFGKLGVISKFSRAFVLIGPATDDGSRILHELHYRLFQVTPNT